MGYIDCLICAMTVLQVARGAMPEADRGDMRWLVALLEAERDLVFQVAIQIDRWIDR